MKSLKHLLHQNLRSPAPAQIPIAAQQVVYANLNQVANGSYPEAHRLMNYNNSIPLALYQNSPQQIPMQPHLAQSSIP